MSSFSDSAGHVPKAFKVLLMCCLLEVCLRFCLIVVICHLSFPNETIPCGVILFCLFFFPSSGRDTLVLNLICTFVNTNLGTFLSNMVQF